MEKSELAEYCLTKIGAYPDFPFAEDGYAVVKTRKSAEGISRIFAEIFTLRGKDMLTFSSDENTAAFLREQYPDIVVRGWHCPPVQATYKSSVAMQSVDDATLRQFVDISYCYVWNKLK